MVWANKELTFDFNVLESKELGKYLPKYPGCQFHPAFLSQLELGTATNKSLIFQCVLCNKTLELCWKTSENCHWCKMWQSSFDAWSKDPIMPVLKSLQWQLVAHQTQGKVLMCRVFKNLATGYLWIILPPLNVASWLRSAGQLLWRCYQSRMWERFLSCEAPRMHFLQYSQYLASDKNATYF